VATAILVPRSMQGGSSGGAATSHYASSCDPASLQQSSWLPHTIAAIDPLARTYPKIPQSFMGLSWEWTNLTDCLIQPRLPEMLNYLTSFGGGPLLIRIGGSSTDDANFTQPAEVFQAMTKIHYATGARFMLGLNLMAADPSLSLAQMQAAQAQMPAEAIVTFEIGNEVSCGGTSTARAEAGGRASAGALLDVRHKQRPLGQQKSMVPAPSSIHAPSLRFWPLCPAFLPFPPAELLPREGRQGLH
jgi:hypothetical protein